MRLHRKLDFGSLADIYRLDTRQFRSDNPHINYFNGLFRGYCVCDVNKTRGQTTYHAVDDLTALQDIDNPLALVPYQDTPVSTDAVLAIQQGFNQTGSEQRLSVSYSRE